MNYTMVCQNCGSEEVARCKWVNVNTEEVYDADSGTSLEWCFKCNEQTEIIDEEDYEPDEDEEVEGNISDDLKANYRDYDINNPSEMERFVQKMRGRHPDTSEDIIKEWIEIVCNINYQEDDV